MSQEENIQRIEKLKDIDKQINEKICNKNKILSEDYNFIKDSFTSNNELKKQRGYFYLNFFDKNGNMKPIEDINKSFKQENKTYLDYQYCQKNDGGKKSKRKKITNKYIRKNPKKKTRRNRRKSVRRH